MSESFYGPSPFDSFAVFIFALAWTSVAGLILGPFLGSWSISAFTVFLSFIPLAATLLRGFDFRETFRFRIPVFCQMTGGLLLASGMLIFVIIASFLISSFLPNLPLSGKNIRVNVNDPNLPRLVVSVVVLPAICEELLFRGFILSGIDHGEGRFQSCVLCGLLFGLLHMEPVQMPFTVAVGVVLSWVAQKSGSIIIPMLMHGFHNLVLLLIARFTLSSGYAWEIVSLGPSRFTVVVCFIASLSVAAVLIAAGIWFVGRRTETVSSDVFP